MSIKDWNPTPRVRSWHFSPSLTFPFPLFLSSSPSLLSRECIFHFSKLSYLCYFLICCVACLSLNSFLRKDKNLQWHLWDGLGQGPRAQGLPSSLGNTKTLLILIPFTLLPFEFLSLILFQNIFKSHRHYYYCLGW